MNVFKQFNATDIVTTPFVVNKSFSFSGSNNFTGSDIGIDTFVGTTPSQSFINTASAATTGYITTQYQDLVFSSIRQLYYSNYYSQSHGDNATTASILLNNFYITSSDDPSQPIENMGEFLNNTTGNPLFNITGGGRTTTNYYNYLSNTLTASRTLLNLSADDPDNPTGLGVISIPSNLFGEYIKPGSFKTTVGKNLFDFICTDDSNGNIFVTDDDGHKQVGNIIYEHGIIIFTTNKFITGSGTTTILPSEYVKAPDLKIEFSSSMCIYETQFNTRLRESEYNFTNNPTVLSGSDGTPYDYITGSFFKPYITTVGLYNEKYDLIAVGKLAQPLPKSDVVDTNIIINLDMY